MRESLLLYSLNIGLQQMQIAFYCIKTPTSDYINILLPDIPDVCQIKHGCSSCSLSLYTYLEKQMVVILQIGLHVFRSSTLKALTPRCSENLRNDASLF